MKLFFVALSLLATNAFANDTETMSCENVAHEVAAFINKSGWGEVKGYVPVTTQSRTEDGFLIYRVSIKSANDTLGDSYEIVMRRDGKSEACITLSVNK